MLPYFIVFALSCVLTFAAEINEKRGKSKKAKFLLFLSIIPLVVLAGLRIPELGHDMKLYGYASFKSASIRNFSELIPFLKNTYNLEKGFFVYVFLLTRIVNNVNFVMFGLQLIVSICFIFFCYSYRNKTSMTLMMLIYCCTLYAFSYNILRQSIALAIFMLSLLFFEKRKKILSIILIIIALFFHSSVLFSLIVPIIIYLCDTKKINFKFKMVLLFLIVFMAILGLIFYSDIINFLYNIGVIGSRFASYTSESSANYRNTINIEYSLLGLKTYCMILSILYFLCSTINKTEKKENFKWFIMLIIDYFITFLSFKLANTDRISWYLYYPATFIFIPQTIKVFKSDFQNRLMGFFVIAFIFIIYIIEKFVTNQYAICPYQWIL